MPPDLIAELTELSALAGPSGAEEPVATWLRSRLRDAGRTALVDSLGNLVVAGRTPPRVCVIAHMDQVGFMVSRLHDDHADCLPVGQPVPPRRRQVRVRVVAADRAPIDGVLSSTRGARGAAQLRSAHLDRIRIGDRVLFDAPLEHLGDGLLRGPALDNRIGCIVALNAARALAGSDPGVAFAWTVREETEQSGVLRVAQDLRPACLVAVDITYATSPDRGRDSPLCIGAGPAMTLLDGGMVAHDPLVRTFDKAARDLGIGWQPEIVTAGMSEAANVQRTLGIPSLALLVAIEQPHSPRETANVRDVVQATDLLVAGLRALVGEQQGAAPLGLAGQLW